MDKMDKMNKFIGSVIDIQETKPTAEQIAYLGRALILTTLPHSKPKRLDSYIRTNGNSTLNIQSTRNKTTGEYYGIPFGSIPRLVLMWLTREAVKNKSRHIKIGNSLADFMHKLDITPTGGRNGSIRRLTDQMTRLFKSVITIEQSHPNRKGGKWESMQIAPRGEIWFNSDSIEQGIIWNSWIELGEIFYESILDAPVPLDMRAVKALKQSPLGLDLYAWLSYRSFTLREAKKPLFVPLEALKRQLGADYSRANNFNAKIRRQLLKVGEVSQVEFDVVKAVKGQTKAGITIKNRGKLNIQSLLT